MQQLAFKAYGEVTSRTGSDQQIEYALFQEITQSLQEVAQNDDPPAALWADAIDRNMQLWTILATDLLTEENQLNPELKKGLLTLSQSVRRLSHSVLAGDAELEELIDINEIIMRGLRGQVDQPGQEAAA
ncbi:flagellar biosynthesis regulator FlaF [Henriciella aquimarina]|uniref:flagellar biosynthesis regulator FlaF n=1 Tax=Henriciella aquimarina TaxID=545261 RepID=UPI000A040F0C|nr:flagellar biosynthesis regulator FlaF [Henriciella aquimarina]